MPVSIELSDNNRYIIYEMSDPVNMDELMHAYAKERKFRDEHDHTMHSIVDMSGVGRIPPRWLTAKAGPGLTHPRSGFMVFTGVSLGLRIVLDTILKFARYEKVIMAESREDAQAKMMEILKKEDETVKQEATTG
jgi:hypothetical protein